MSRKQLTVNLPKAVASTSLWH